MHSSPSGDYQVDEVEEELLVGTILAPPGSRWLLTVGPTRGSKDLVANGRLIWYDNEVGGLRVGGRGCSDDGNTANPGGGNGGCGGCGGGYGADKPRDLA